MKRDIKGIYITEVNYLETSRGVAYTAPLYMDGKKIGTIENKGDGGVTSIFVKEYSEELNRRIDEYLKEKSNKEVYDKKEEFANDVIDIFEFGKVLTEEEKEKLLIDLKNN